MIKSLSYLFSSIYYLVFGSILVFFHPLQVICFQLFGVRMQSRVVSTLNFWLIRCLGLLGTRVQFNNPHTFPKGRTLVFVANHQSTYDIPPIIWFLRRYQPKFVAKKELGKGLPSISYHLRNGGNVLIDRKDSVGSLKAIKQFCSNVYANGLGIVFNPFINHFKRFLFIALQIIVTCFHGFDGHGCFCKIWKVMRNFV